MLSYPSWENNVPTAGTHLCWHPGRGGQILWQITIFFSRKSSNSMGQSRGILRDPKGTIFIISEFPEVCSLWVWHQKTTIKNDKIWEFMAIIWPQGVVSLSPTLWNFLEIKTFKASLDSWANPALYSLQVGFPYWSLWVPKNVMPLPPSFRKSHLSSQVQRSKGYSSHIESWDFAHDRRVEHEEFHLNPDEFPQENPGGKWMKVVHLFFQGSHMRHGSSWWERRGCE